MIARTQRAKRAKRIRKVIDNSVPLDVLFETLSGGCQAEGCGHEHGPMFLHPRCHPRAGTWVSVDVATRKLCVACAKCRKIVVEVQCPPPRRVPARAAG